MKEKEKARNKRLTQWIEVTCRNQNVHDSVGNIYTLKSKWIVTKDYEQPSIWRIILNENEVFRWAKEITDDILRKQVKDKIGYMRKSEIIEVIEI